MKKIMSVLLIAILVMSVLALTGCGGSSDQDLSDSKYVGTWKAADVSLGDESEAIEGEFILTVNPDGTGTLVGTEEGSETSNFTWSPTDDGFKCKGDVKATFKEDGDRIYTEILGAKLAFEKQN